jgi:hypothetical protein
VRRLKGIRIKGKAQILPKREIQKRMSALVIGRFFGKI